MEKDDKDKKVYRDKVIAKDQNDLITPEAVRKAGYANIFESIVGVSKWARELNLDRKRKKETGKILEEFDLENFKTPDEVAADEKSNKKITMDALQDLVDKKIKIQKI